MDITSSLRFLSRSMLSFVVLSAITASAAGPASPAPAQPAGTLSATTTENGDNVSLNFNNAEIDAVIRAIGKLSGRNFLIDPRVKGTINIVTNHPVPRSLTYSILLSALRLQGYAVVEDKDVVKVLPEADAKLHAVQVDKNRNKSVSGDRIMTEVFKINYESANQLVQVVRPLVTANNTVSVYPANNSLVITDYAENIARIGRIIESIDVPQGDSQVIKVESASAVDLATLLNKLFVEGAANNADPSMKVTILADARSNTLLVRAENRSRMQAVRSMVMQLDQPTSFSNVRVVYLKNADAAKVAETLRGVLAKESSSGTSASTTTSSPQPSSTSNTGSTGGITRASTTGTQSAINIGGGSVFADTANNALIITAPDSVYNNIRGVIDQLDRRPAQIYVEALLAELTSERAAQYGIQWLVGAGSGSTAAVTGTNFGTSTGNILQIAQGNASVNTGMNFVVGTGSVKVGNVTIPDLTMLANFLESDTNANILSTPSLVTVDNEEAKIVVGSNVPFVTGTYTSTGTTSSVSNPFQTIERKDVGLTLKIKPQITEGGTIRLQISEETSAVIDSTSSNANGPSTTKRSLDSVVIANDGEIIALGGLVQDTYSGGVDKVPVLGDLPILGPLFRSDTRKRSKTNLVIFLRPRIIRTASDARAITEGRYEYVIGKQHESDIPGERMKGEEPAPQLPPMTPAAPADASAPAATPAQ